MSEELDLDDAQKASLVEILTAADAERDALREEHGKQIRKDMCAPQQSTNGQIKDVLTPHQSADFDELMAEMQARRENHSRPRGEDRRPHLDCEGDAD